MREWSSHLWYEGNYWMSMLAMTLGFSLRTEGQQYVPRTGPALLIANHQSFIDTVPIGLAARRHLVYLRAGLSSTLDSWHGSCTA